MEWVKKMKKMKTRTMIVIEDGTGGCALKPAFTAETKRHRTGEAQVDQPPMTQAYDVCYVMYARCLGTSASRRDTLVSP